MEGYVVRSKKTGKTFLVASSKKWERYWVMFREEIPTIWQDERLAYQWLADNSYSLDEVEVVPYSCVLKANWREDEEVDPPMTPEQEAKFRSLNGL